MAFRYLVVAIVASVITVFALQNSTPISIRFLFWQLEAVPLATVILLAVGGGVVLAGLPLVVDRWRLRARVRALEAQAASAEALLTQRAQAPERPGSP
jgi:uncharacterized integral membrane protein